MSFTLTLEKLDKYKSLDSSELDPLNVNHWHINSPIWAPIWYNYLKNYDYFTIKIGQYLKIPPLYKYEHLNYPNPKSQLILDLCFNAYREILNNGATFTYHTSPLDREVLGIDTIGPNPALDGLILDNINVAQPGNHPYWQHRSNYHETKFIIGCNWLPCNLHNLTDIHSKITEIMNHLAWIRGRFDTLNDNPYESEKMEKWMEVMWLISVRCFIKVSWNTARNNVVAYSDIWEDFKNNNPNDILREHLEKYQAQQDALAARQAEVALVDDQGNNDQTDASFLIGNLNTIDDTY